MNAVEIEEAISKLAEQDFDAASFPFAFLEAFGNKEVTLKRLRTGATNKSDIPNGVLQTNHIHIATCARGNVSETLTALYASPATTKGKAKFLLATDGVDFEAADLVNDEFVSCAYPEFPNHFGFFLPLAGISTVRQISENAFDIRATSRLNRLYVQLLKDNPDWGRAERRHDMNHFMARIIFCFFAEDTDIFVGRGRFTDTIAQMSDKDSSNTHEVLSTLFRAMNSKPGPDRAVARIPRWADDFPYVNGGLFSGSMDVPTFSKIARSYLLHVGGLDWTKINPDIFGSMIQAVAEDEERGELGMHYTSVPNILKVLNPLFLDDLRRKLDEAGDNQRMLLNLRKRMARIRVFDPACGSGNFLVIAYKEMRGIEAEINRRREETDRASELPLTNYRGIELRDFPAEIARLALVIAEYQCDVLYRGQRLALAEFLPLRNENWITCGNALRIDWLSICPPTGAGVKYQADDLFDSPLTQTQIDFDNEGGETYICGNPPYIGSSLQNEEHKRDLARTFSASLESWKNIDYIAAWFFKAAEFARVSATDFAFVSTNSICQGQQVPLLWPLLLDRGIKIYFAHTSFKWSNLASYNAGVTVAIIGCTRRSSSASIIFSTDESGQVSRREVAHINPYLVAGPDVIVEPRSRAIDDRGVMLKGNMPSDGGNLILSTNEKNQLVQADPSAMKFVYGYCGSRDYIHGESRWCLWINDAELKQAVQIPDISARLDAVRDFRMTAKALTTRPWAAYPHKFRQVQSVAAKYSIIIPRHSSEAREYLPVGVLNASNIISDAALAIYDAELWNLSIIASRLQIIWVSTVCGKIKTDFRYSNTQGWNAFPIPKLTGKQKDDLTRCAEDILLARERHFPATIAELYEPAQMPSDLRAAHERNDEVLERIYIGRRFKNDTERLEKLFDLYTKMTAAEAPLKIKKRKVGARA